MMTSHESSAALPKEAAEKKAAKAAEKESVHGPTHGSKRASLIEDKSDSKKGKGVANPLTDAASRRNSEFGPLA